MRNKRHLGILATILLPVMAWGCTAELVIEEVQVPVEVVREVVVEREVPVEVVIEKEVIREIPGKTITVTKEVPVEKVVTKEVLKEVNVIEIKEVEIEKLVKEIVVATPGPVDFYVQTLNPNHKRGGVLKWISIGPAAHWDYFCCGSLTWHGTMHTMYDRLLVHDTRTADMTVIPEIGTSWERSPDGKTYTFQIRDGVKFHSGEDLTGHDVKATFDRGVFLEFGEGLASVNRGVMQSATLKEITSTDSEVVFNFEEAPSMTHAMAGFTDFSFKLSRKADWEAHKGSFKKIDLKKVTGSGPFKFVETTADHFLVEANVDYWNPHTPYLDGVETIYFAPFTPALTAAVQTHMVDIAQATAPGDTAKLSQIPLIQHNVTLWPFYWHVLFNANRAPFNDVRMRQAAALVIEPEALVIGMNQSLGATFGGGWFPQGMGTREYTADQLRQQKYFRSPTEGDIAEAKALLADAGYPEGTPLPKLDLPGRNNKFNTVTMELVQAMLLQQLGWESELRMVDVGTWREIKSAGEFDMGLNNALYTVPLPESFIRDITGTCGDVPCNFNLGKFKDPVLDDLWAKLKAAAPADRYAVSSDVFDQLNKGMPFQPMTQAGRNVTWFYPDVKGMPANGSIYAGFAETVSRFDHVWLDR
jgi:peptide/nickel transport system substrate-binding protein